MSSSRPPLSRRIIIAPAIRLMGRLLLSSQQSRSSQFTELDIGPDHVVFLGDSITEYGIWNEWFPGVPVANRGIGGETAAQVLRRLSSAINAPRAVFLLIGTNDLTLAVPIPEIARRVESILDGIVQRAPGTRVFLQSVMPRAAKYAGDIRHINAEYQKLAHARPERVSYLNLWSALAVGDALNPAFTLDKLHLNGPGYRAWTDVLRPVVHDLTAG